jgi:hypothetical protein
MSAPRRLVFFLYAGGFPLARESAGRLTNFVTNSLWMAVQVPFFSWLCIAMPVV